MGAFLPLMPWFFIGGTAAIVASVVIGAVAALLVGAGLASLTGRSRARSSLRQLVVTGVAAGVTFAIGRAVGIGVS